MRVLCSPQLFRKTVFKELRHQSDARAIFSKHVIIFKYLQIKNDTSFLNIYKKWRIIDGGLSVNFPATGQFCICYFVFVFFEKIANLRHSDDISHVCRAVWKNLIAKISKLFSQIKLLIPFSSHPSLIISCQVQSTSMLVGIF